MADAVASEIMGRRDAEKELIRNNALLSSISHAQSRLISDAQPQVLFDELLNNMLSITKSEYGFIGEILLSDNGDTYLKTRSITNIAWNDETRKFYKENAPSGLEFNNLKSLYGSVITTGKHVISNSPSTDPRRTGIPEGHPPLNAFMGLPLYSGNNLVGMAGLANRPHGYDENIVKFLLPLTATCGSIIESFRNTQLRKEAEETIKRYSNNLLTLSRASSSMLGIKVTDTLYRTICANAMKLFDLKMVWIGTIEEGSVKVRPVAHMGFEDDYLSKISISCDDSPTGCGPVGMSVKMKKPVAMDSGEPAFEPWRAEAIKRGYSSVLSVPLIYLEEKCIGVLALYSEKTDCFTPDRIELCQILANQASVVIENASLIEGLEEKVEQRTSAMMKINEQLQSEVAERKMAEEKLLVINKELALAKDMAESATKAKSDFLANMSHELRTPLNAIIGFSELMIIQGPSNGLSDENLEYLTYISESGDLLLSLINDILDLSKVEAGAMELQYSKLNVEDLIERSIIFFKERSLKKNVKLTSHVDPDTGYVEADEMRMKQVIVNLLSNAIKFTPAKGSVNISARTVACAETTAGLKDNLQGKEVMCLEICVEDTGIGIKPENIDKLFAPFQQLETSITKEYGGTGLGLALSKKIVELHNGRIWAESEEGKGSRFIFTIPLESGKQEAVFE